MNRCCARCKHPLVSCRNVTCKCHGADIDAEIISIRNYLEDNRA